MSSSEIVCPTCGESFEVVLPPADEQPCRVDYDCEVCCRPLVLCFEAGQAWALGIGD